MMPPRRSIDAILAAVIAEHPMRFEGLDVACYLLRVHGRWSFDQIAEATGADLSAILGGINHVSRGLRLGDARNTVLLLERARRRLNGGSDG